ncbi:hypothetical protein JEOAER750_01817 [Jeotgalicoccus aerolatus]|uniref:Uncharacterized protein n=1 Tax=Jeotgalicoccus aerolatus TaxID=709510 RepID=A0A1G8ZFE1_9STAP|nr:hypothetical protein [Jeotgalicoccus aerolatus]MBP1951125.1 hypothetical protein [Jeotgalicoccus aerolatus]NMA80608.1 hypothetical protein [Jeotgalicoccus aerolatus]CAD2077995.1 hypothetical protein JEOAER750_01817 [Jeotgalicoccus aerolatus]SDK13747.1 hypothetical protein SAMN05216187_10553 [Jeotgalicoccus aerolatus]GGE00057.1 hypothetical protein GCM10007273_10540 [Jeotgalicoccus aerolatus]
MFTLFLILLIVAIVIVTHLIVTYLLKNDIKIVGIAIGFVGVIAAIIVFGIAMGSFTDYVAGELEFFYR